MMGLGMFFVASQCFGCQVLSNHPGKGTSSLKMSKTMKTTFTTKQFFAWVLSFHSGLLRAEAKELRDAGLQSH